MWIFDKIVQIDYFLVLKCKMTIQNWVNNTKMTKKRKILILSKGVWMDICVCFLHNAQGNISKWEKWKSNDSIWDFEKMIGKIRGKCRDEKNVNSGKEKREKTHDELSTNENKIM